MLKDLYTEAGEALEGAPWQVYPRPQMKRDSFFNLNGIWELATGTEPVIPREFPLQINVPFCPESLLSGVHQHFGEDMLLFYRRSFTLPEDFNRGRVLLHFGAVDQEATLFLNGEYVCHHTGGYSSFSCDITDHLQPENQLVVMVRDDLRDKSYPYGKQTLKRGGMWYTPVSGIWQTVWLESVPRE